MQRLLVIFALVVLSLACQGCASLMDLNPFSSPAPAKPGEAAYTQFAGILVPTAMRPVPSRTHVIMASDGNKNGVEAFEGNVKMSELATVMARNMERESWRLLTAQQGGGREVQVYEQQSLQSALHFHTQGSLTLMEIWVGSRLIDGQYPFGTMPIPDSPVYDIKPIAPGRMPSTAPNAAPAEMPTSLPHPTPGGTPEPMGRRVLPYIPPTDGSTSGGGGGGFTGRIPPSAPSSPAAVSTPPATRANSAPGTTPGTTPGTFTPPSSTVKERPLP